MINNGMFRKLETRVKFSKHVPFQLGHTPLHLAAQQGYEDIVELLISYGAPTNIKTYVSCI